MLKPKERYIGAKSLRREDFQRVNEALSPSCGTGEKTVRMDGM
jgi:hypothetical protein